FFPYPLDDVAATVRYARNSVWMTGFRARHGETTVQVKQATAFLPPAGGFSARLDGLQAPRPAPDPDLSHALPGPLRRMLKTLNPRQPVDLNTVLVVKQPAEAGTRPTLYWDALIKMRDQLFQAGPEWSEVTGTLSCQGLHNGQQLEDVTGNVFLERAT